VAILVAVAALAVLKVVTTRRVIAVLVVQHVAAMTVAATTAVVSVVVLVAGAVLLPVAVRALHLGKIVALLHAVTTKAMAASPALVICSNAVARLPAAPMGLRRSARPMPRPVVQANPLRPTNRASARHAPDL